MSDYDFLALPQGLHGSPTIFTKLLKPVLAHLCSLGHTVLVYIDDTLLQGDTHSECKAAVASTCELLDNLGLSIHPVKSVFDPTQCIEFLGFQLDLCSMLASLTADKANKIRLTCENFLAQQNCSIRQLAEIIGQTVAVNRVFGLHPYFTND